MPGLAGFFVGTEMPDANWWETLWPDPAGVLTSAGLQPNTNVVDLCCGDGWFTLPIARIARKVTAIDLDVQLLGLARSRLAQNNIANCDFVEGDAYDLATLVAPPVDFVFLANVFHGVPDKPRLMNAVASVLSPGGHFAMVNWHARNREETTVLGLPRGPKTELRMTPEQTIAAARSPAFKLSRVVDVPPYHYGVVLERLP
jgi:ubiquinone/menaquinone biosynthesis C-methylase UbiE